MSKVINGIVYIEPEPDDICEYCGNVAELRPYGKNNERICHECGKKDMETTIKKMEEHLFNKANLINPDEN